MSGMTGIRLKGGKLDFEKLTSQMQKEKPVLFEMKKVFHWEQMINEGMRPTLWRAPSKKGTKVTFVFIQNDEELEQAFKELKKHIDIVNKRYDKPIMNLKDSDGQ